MKGVFKMARHYNKKKRKKKKKDSMYLEKYFTGTVNTQWESIIADIECLIKDIDKSDEKARKKKRNTASYKSLQPTKKQVKVRKTVIELFQDSTFLESILYALTHARGFIQLIARLFCLLIVTLLSIDFIRMLVPDKLMIVINNLYEMARNCK